MPRTTSLASALRALVRCVWAEVQASMKAAADVEDDDMEEAVAASRGGGSPRRCARKLDAAVETERLRGEGELSTAVGAERKRSTDALHAEQLASVQCAP